jgi:hypothetical protein
VGRQLARAARLLDALGVRVASLGRVAFRRNHDVLAHRVQTVAAERAAICCGLEALRATKRPPAWLVHF